MADKSGYAGKIKNTGSMEVKAVFAQTSGKKPVVKTGGDLRSSKKSGK